MRRLAKLSARYIGEGGFSIGITDVTPAEELKREKTKVINDNYATCTMLIDQFKSGVLELLPGCSEEQSLEVRYFCTQCRVCDSVRPLCCFPNMCEPQ
jgi:DNA-directed RNA polymerase III subunit RPC1